MGHKIAHWTGTQLWYALESVHGEKGNATAMGKLAHLRSWVGRARERPLRLPHFVPKRSKPGDPAIFGFNADRDAIVHEVIRRVCQQYDGDPRAMEQAINDAAFHETRRLASQKDLETKNQLGFWSTSLRRLGRLPLEQQNRLLMRIVDRFARDVAGNFDTRVYRVAARMTPRIVKGIMKPRTIPEMLLGGDPTVVRVEGATDLLRSLSRTSSLIYVPTHSSNLDSIVLAHALLTASLPPVIYGAGKNLFTNPLISFFMHNLGAYRVDRRIRAQLYKEVLKTYATVTIERGYHSLFFPGGTRSRSGAVEQHLKLGLLGAAVEAHTRNMVNGRPKPLWFVPTTINYALVLEAETLIEDHLKARGKARYIIDDDEFSQAGRWLAFLRKVVNLSGACVVRFGHPVDAFGNRADGDGRSISPQGVEVDPASYLKNDGQLTYDPDRNKAYTHELGELIASEYKHNTVVMFSQLVAHVMFRHLVAQTPELDLFMRLRHRGEVAMPKQQLISEVAEAARRLDRLEAQGAIRVSYRVRHKTAEDIVGDAMAAFDGYHTHRMARRVEQDIVLTHPPLLYFYQNRLHHVAEALAHGTRVEAAARETARATGW